MAKNYRPVSFTSVSCKLLEHIIRKHLLRSSDNGLISQKLLLK